MTKNICNNPIYFENNLTEEQARKIAFMLFHASKSLLGHTVFANSVSYRSILDYDYWYGISNNWDVNIYGGWDCRLKCCIYPVVEGNTDTSHPIRINEREIDE